jgi:hypothetical protein
MTVTELKQLLVASAVPDEAYDLTGGHPNEAYVFDFDGRHWRVYYSERGIESGVKEFTNESDACEYLCEVLIKDSTTARPNHPRPKGVTEPGTPRWKASSLKDFGGMPEAVPEDLVNTFDEAPIEEIGSVADQRDYFLRWLQSFSRQCDPKTGRPPRSETASWR